ncbi:MAG: hypothetical protein A2004_06475 [Spirochaetes bacterium GWC1_61_12]|nr:MAG: hypothetical protein A2004_06475 [Spirochaetes bacterium GWC1_61_12]OHD59630.1 MAG: hypothetical protein A2Y32_12150 [Spirochaetes bacterium GWF1_60_12]
MGHERNRGKLADLNHLLQGASNHDFQSIIGDRTQLRAGRYVITLDTDTQLPRDSARQLVGIMAHPLNQARYDEKTGRVTEGYGILQPRMLTRYAGARQSWYALLNNNEPGIDPYT